MRRRTPISRIFMALVFMATVAAATETTPESTPSWTTAIPSSSSSPLPVSSATESLSSEASTSTESHTLSPRDTTATFTSESAAEATLVDIARTVQSHRDIATTEEEGNGDSSLSSLLPQIPVFSEQDTRPAEATEPTSISSSTGLPMDHTSPSSDRSTSDPLLSEDSVSTVASKSGTSVLPAVEKEDNGTSRRVEDEKQTEGSGQKSALPPSTMQWYVLVLRGNSTIVWLREDAFVRYLKLNLAARLSAAFDDLRVNGVMSAAQQLLVNVSVDAEKVPRAGSTLVSLAQGNTTLLELSGEVYNLVRVLRRDQDGNEEEEEGEEDEEREEAEGSSGVLATKPSPTPSAVHAQLQAVVYAAVGGALAFLLLSTLVLAVTKLWRSHSEDKDLEKEPVARARPTGLRLEDLTLTKIPRPHLIYSDAFARSLHYHHKGPEQYSPLDDSSYPVQANQSSVVPLADDPHASLHRSVFRGFLSEEELSRPSFIGCRDEAASESKPVTDGRGATIEVQTSTHVAIKGAETPLDSPRITVTRCRRGSDVERLCQGPAASGSAGSDNPSFTH